MVKLSTRGRYATRIMVFMALRDEEKPAQVREIAEAEGLTPDYVVQILTQLKSGGLVESRRGKGGGFLLAREPALITVADVLEATEGGLRLAPCVADACQRGPLCVTQALWREANDALTALFSSRTIGGLAQQAREMTAGQQLSYAI